MNLESKQYYSKFAGQVIVSSGTDGVRAMPVSFPRIQRMLNFAEESGAYGNTEMAGVQANWDKKIYYCVKKVSITVICGYLIRPRRLELTLFGSICIASIAFISFVMRQVPPGTVHGIIAKTLILGAICLVVRKCGLTLFRNGLSDDNYCACIMQKLVSLYGVSASGSVI